MNRLNATDILRKEHDAIERMLEVTEQVAKSLENGQHVAPETLHDLQEFFQLFADKCHHGKEEELLFPLLERKGLARAGGPIGVMVHEHEQGRSFIRQMTEAATGYANSVPNAGQQWASAARMYVSLLRLHIQKENNVLFPMANQLLSVAEQGELAQAFEKVEAEKMGVGTHERLHSLMNRLAADVVAGQNR